MSLDRTYPVEILRRFNADELRLPPADEVDRGEEDGLAGNQYYQDLRVASWNQVAEVVAQEAGLIARFAAAEDLDAEAETYDDERLAADDDAWGLDVGVAGAVFALSAMGAVPVGSCNAGGFGGHHVASYPYVAFLLAPDLAGDVLAIAARADVGLEVIENGIGCLFGRSDLDLHRFAVTALEVRAPEI